MRSQERKRHFPKSSQYFLDRIQTRNTDEWRSRFPTVFINNLSRRVSKSTLWEAFNQYGVVMDVFISFRSSKPLTFAFMRYIWESECHRAVVNGNQRIIDGRIISIRRARYWWTYRKNPLGEALVGNSNVEVPLGNHDMVKEIGKGPDKNKMVSPLGGVSIAIIFQSHEGMITFFDKENVVAAPFMEALGNRWGTFVRADDYTIRRERLDFSRTLVTVESRLDIPGTVSVCVKDVSYRITVSLVEDNPMMVGPSSDNGDKSEENDHACTTPMELASVNHCSMLTEAVLIGGELVNVPQSPSRKSNDMEVVRDSYEDCINGRIDEGCPLNDPRVSSMLGIISMSGLGDGFNAKQLELCRKSAHCRKNGSQNGRKKRRTKKEVADIIRIGKEAEAVSLDSILDEEIEFPNTVIRRETCIAFILSNELGLKFGCIKESAMDVFHRLEDVD
ncbi:hypothetical protein PTKIN_Ptkin08bG0012300 [Pterospermum kingtungense]